MCLVWLNRSGVDATFYDAVEFDPMLTVTIGRNRPIAAIQHHRVRLASRTSLVLYPGNFEHAVKRFDLQGLTGQVKNLRAI